VGLQLDEAEHDLRAGALEVPGPADVRFLVEAGLSSTSAVTDFARLRGFRERRHDRRVGRGPVERLLDRDHVRIPRRLAQELDHRVEGLVGVVDDDVLLPDRRESIAAVLADALREAGIVGLVLQVGRSSATSWESSFSRACLPPRRCVARDLEFLGHEGRNSSGMAASTRGGCDAAPALLQHRLEEAHQVFRLFLDLDLRSRITRKRALPLTA
jgi:hypothetical protein